MVFGLLIGIVYLFCDVLYWAKWASSFLALLLWKKIHKRRFDLYDFEDERPDKWGILIPEEEKTLEYPFPEEHLQNNADEIFIYGVNSKCETLLVRISRLSSDVSDAWVCLKLSDGRIYELEQQSGGFQRNVGGKCTSFTCGGLQMQCMAAMRRWRIVYCGMLRERKNDNKMENNSVFVKFTLMWTASSEVYDSRSDFDVRATADAMARSTWKLPFPPVRKVVESVDFYSQSGIMTGIVSIENEDDIEMYLFGEKMRYAGKTSNLIGCQFKQIFGVVPESGLVLHLGKSTFPNTLENLYFGFIVHPNGLLYALEDGHIISNLTGNDAQGKNLTVMFKAEKQQYELRGNLVHDGVRCKNQMGPNTCVELIETEFEVDGLKGRGFMIYGKLLDLPQGKIQQRTLPILHSTKPLTVFLTDGESHLSELTGGKGSSLGKLTKLSKEMKTEFTVPNGIVVTTVAYEQFVTSETLEKIDNLKNIVYGNVKGNIHEACKIVSMAIERSYLPDNITKEIEEKLGKLFDGNVNRYKVAVRSSATGEDTDQLSAAGQMDTFLGVQGLKEILTAVKKCWASQFGYIAIEYKRQNGQVLNSPMAVIIQEMVECEAAGVLFTCDPVTNNPTVAVISGNYGLGESVVSGAEEPDTVVLEKLPNNEVKVKSVTIGLKQHRIVMTDMENFEEEDGTVTEDVPEEEKNRCCISEEMAVKLGKLSLNIENYFKSPRDIEWGVKSNSIFILQSRPVTSHGAISDYEIKHEFDGPLRCEIDYFSRNNVGEVMPGAISPLSMDIVNKVFCAVFMNKSVKLRQRNNFQQSKYFATGLAPFCNQLHLSVADLLTRTDDCETTISQSMMIGVFGCIIDDPHLSLLLKYRKYKPLKKGAEYYLTFLKGLFFSGHGIKELKEGVFNFVLPALKGKTSHEIFKLLIPSSNHVIKPALKHIICTEMSALWNMLMLGILGKAKGGIDTEAYSDFAKLLASFSNVESADVPAAMQDLAQAVVKDIDGDVFRAMTVEEAQNWLETSNSVSSDKYHKFLQRHGHRCLKEFDVYTIPWNEDPKPLISLLQKMSVSSGDVKEKKEEDFSNILPHLTIPLNFKSRFLLKLILPYCRKGVREREICKTIMVKSMDNIRKGIRHLSKVMVAEGYLPDTSLMYFLTLDEIDELLESRNPRIIARANHRRRIFPALDALKFPDLSKGRPVPIIENQSEEFEYVADLTMKGIPVSQGMIKGYARVAVSLEEASHLKPGEILITHGTDIGWSPYFPILAGVVTELGGLVSHGAVISREYGLPCIVGVQGATKQFVTGDYVLLDSSKGILQRLSPPEK